MGRERLLRQSSAAFLGKAWRRAVAANLHAQPDAAAALRYNSGYTLRLP